MASAKKDSYFGEDFDKKKVTLTVLYNAISEMKTSISTDIKDVRDDISACRDQVVGLRAEMEEFREDIATISTRVSETESRLSQVEEAMDKNNALLVQEISQLKTKLNDDEQWRRNYSIRIVGYKLPATCSNNAETAKHLFDKFLGKIIEKGLDSGLSLGKWDHYIETAHPLGSRSGVPNIIVRFYSRVDVNNLMKNKRNVLQSLKNDIGNVFINQDLTPKNAKCMTELRKDKSVESVWFMGKIRFRLHGNNKTFQVLDVEKRIVDMVSRSEYQAAIKAAETAKTE